MECERTDTRQMQSALIRTVALPVQACCGSAPRKQDIPAGLALSFRAAHRGPSTAIGGCARYR